MKNLYSYESSKILELENDNFSMNVNLEAFFPSSQKNIKTLVEKNINECYESNMHLYQLCKFIDYAIKKEYKENGSYKVIEKLEKNKYFITRKYMKDDITALKKIYFDINDGIIYGYNVNDVKYPYFHESLYIIPFKDFIEWNHYGSSANGNTLNDLAFVIYEIFETCPTDFIKKYEKKKAL